MIPSLEESKNTNCKIVANFPGGRNEPAYHITASQITVVASTNQKLPR